MNKLNGLTALVTGGGRGIGRSIALHLARAGANVVISSRTKSELDSVISEIEVAGGTGLSVVADVTNKESAILPIKKAVEHFGKLDILINNAGGRIVGNQDPFNEDPGIFEANLVLNLTSAHWATVEALPHMRQNNFGRIIMIGSGYSKRSGGDLAYTAAKHGLVGLAKALASKVANMDVTVNVLCPGWTNTDLVDWKAMGQARGTDATEAHQWASSNNLQNRVLEPDELGPMAVLLSSPESYGITGQVISVDGGYKV